MGETSSPTIGYQEYGMGSTIFHLMFWIVARHILYREEPVGTTFRLEKIPGSWGRLRSTRGRMSEHRPVS